MTDTGTTTTVYEIEDPQSRDLSAVPSFPFKIGDELFTIYAPKLSTAVQLMSVFGADGNPRQVSTREGLALTSALWEMMRYIAEQDPEPPTTPNPEWVEWDEIVDNPEPEPPREIPNPKAGLLRGQERLRERLNDARDALDVEHLAPVFGQALAAMFRNRRPTTPSRGHSPASRNGGHASAGDSSGPQGVTSTT